MVRMTREFVIEINQAPNMYLIGSNGSISRDDSRFANLVDTSVPNVRDFQDF